MIVYYAERFGRLFFYCWQRLPQQKRPETDLVSASRV